MGMEGPKSSKREMLATKVDEVTAFYFSGDHTLKETAEHFGCSETTLFFFFKSRDIPTSWKARTARLHSDGWRCPRCEKMVPREGWSGRNRGNRPGAAYCQSCLTGANREYHQKNYDPEKQRLINIERREYNVEWTKKNLREMRLKIIDAYGGECACCRVSHAQFLAIDHVDGGGNKHRQELKEKGMGQREYFMWIIDNNYPDLFRILCHNCNFSFGHHGYCPHVGRPDPPDAASMSPNDRENYWKRVTHRNLRAEVINGYGGRCACCDESAYEFLAIDHINGGGRREAMERKTKGIGPMQWLRSLRREGYPPGLRILCHNCNSSLGWYGNCPHSMAI